MSKFFDLDGKFFKYGSLLWDIIILTLLWTVTSLPIITVGAATTAVYYVTTRQLSNREGYASRDFFRSFKRNFLQATGVTLFFIVVYGIILVNIITLPGNSPLFPVQFVLLAVATAVLIFVYPVLSRMDLGFFALLRTSFFLAIRHFPTTITCFVLLIAIALLVMWMPILFIICVGCYCWLTSLMFMRIFRKYLPEMDTDEYDEKKHREQLNEENVQES